MSKEEKFEEENPGLAGILRERLLENLFVPVNKAIEYDSRIEALIQEFRSSNQSILPKWTKAVTGDLDHNNAPAVKEARLGMVRDFAKAGKGEILLYFDGGACRFKYDLNLEFLKAGDYYPGGYVRGLGNTLLDYACLIKSARYPEDAKEKANLIERLITTKGHFYFIHTQSLPSDMKKLNAWASDSKKFFKDQGFRRVDRIFSYFQKIKMWSKKCQCVSFPSGKEKDKNLPFSIRAHGMGCTYRSISLSISILDTFFELSDLLKHGCKFIS